MRATDGSNSCDRGQTDKLVENVNSLGQCLEITENVWKSCLNGAARAPEKRDKKAIGNKGAVRVRDILRVLRRIVER